MKISDAEFVLLEALWDRGPAGAASLAEQVAPARGWSLQTVKTLLARLQAKGAIDHDQEGRRHVYRPLVERTAVVDAESERVVDRLFGGRAAPLIARLAERQKLSAQDLEDIRALLDRIERRT